MKNKDVYDSALRILAEKDVAEANEDYEERAPYLLATFCAESAEADRIYRRVNGLPEAHPVNAVFVPLTDEFPCSPRFCSAAATYLAAMLIFDDNTELSDKLFERYSDMMSSICYELPALVEPIRDKHFF
ncbi:MAG: hypothetical protein IJV72_04535 [Clostridia bacterium]|nr:hypothetical protein [Clostridia bacterium]